MDKEIIQLKKILYFFFVCIISFLYISLYISIPNEILRDRANYILYATNFDSISQMRSGSFEYYFNEPLFLKINSLLSFFFSPEQIPFVFVFFNTLILMFLLAKKSRNVVLYILGLLSIIFIPYIFQGQLTALRQALATSLFLLAFYCLNDNKKVFFITLICSFIHSVFFLVSFFYLLNFILFKNRSFNFKMIMNFLLMLFISLSFFVISNLFGLRQGEVYSEEPSQVGGGSFVLFIIIFIIMYFNYKKFQDNSTYFIAMMGMTLFLTGYFLTPLSGRLFNSFFPFLILFLVSYSRKLNYSLLISLIAIYSILYFYGSYNNIMLYDYQSFSEIFQDIKWLGNWI
ncbi:EpsG family protein [Acinetobacter pittii]|uniref:EpsG family protein n=1 Tax=Acinetobacter pittii TaxID=48296 RepID=UPI002A0624F6|nr:EpsG family protein [Acinetobacter pittii]MDX8239809.1 EpsG family protein [Acinetobacter pittii]